MWLSHTVIEHSEELTNGVAVPGKVNQHLVLVEHKGKDASSMRAEFFVKQCMYLSVVIL
jgi:hypothetical protein